MDRYIEVTGEATAIETATEHCARIDVAVQAAPKGGAGSTARELRNAVVRTLRDEGMRDDELIEGGEGRSRSWWRKKHEREASHRILIKTTDYVRMARAIAALEPLAEDKRTSIDVHMPPPKFEGAADARARARTEAFRDARAKADSLAAEAGVRIGGVMHVVELDGHERQRGFEPQGVLYAGTAMESSFEHEELSAPTREVSYALRVTFSIE